MGSKSIFSSETAIRHLPTFLMEKRSRIRQFLAVEAKGVFCAQPDGILKAFIYPHSIDEFEHQIKRRKTDGMQVEKSLGRACVIGA